MRIRGSREGQMLVLGIGEFVLFFWGRGMANVYFC